MPDGLPEVVEEHLPPAQRYSLRLTLFGIAILLVAVPFGALLGEVITDGPATRWDSDIAEWLHELVVGRGGIVTAMEVLSFLGKPIWLFFLLLVPVTWLLMQRRWHLALFLGVTSIGGGILDSIVKLLVARPRPLLDDPVASARGHSFPSGHSMSAVICYGALLVALGGLLSDRARRRAMVAYVALVVSIGISRLALGVHYVTDVLGGYALGAAWLVASVAAWEIWREDRGLPRTAPLDEGVEPEDAEAAAHATA